MTNLRLAALAFALSAASLAHAQTAAPAPAPAAAPAAAPAPLPTSPAKKELVAKLLQIQRPGIEAVARALVEQPAQQAAQSAARVIQLRTPPEQREAASKAADAEIKKYLDESTPIVINKAVALAPSTIGTLLEQRFTEDELKQLIAWIDSPLNRKFQAAGPELQQSLAAKLVTDARSQIEPKVRTMDANIAKALGIAPPADGAGTPGPTAAPAPAPAKSAAPAPAKK